MQKVQGFTEAGNTTLLITGAAGIITRKVQGSFPGATITVFNAGTVVLATIFADDALPSPTAKANPFTSSTDGTWYFYAADGRYDVRFSGGGIAVPFTIGDLQAFDTKRPDLVRNAAAFPGINWGEKVNNAIIDLPSNGGVVDARGLIGTQFVTSVISVNKPTVLLLGAGAVLLQVNNAFDVTNAMMVLGEGTNVSLLALDFFTGIVNMFRVHCMQTFAIRDVRLLANGVHTGGAFIDLDGPDGITSNSNSWVDHCIFQQPWIGIDSHVVDFLRVTNTQFAAVNYRGMRFNNPANGDQGDHHIGPNNTFGEQTANADTAGIEIQSGPPGLIIGNKFFKHKYGILINFTASGVINSTGQLLIEGNRFEPHKTSGAAIHYQRLAGATATYFGNTIVGNWFRSGEDPSEWGNFIDTANVTDGGGSWISELNIAANQMLPRHNMTAIRIGDGSTGGLNISGNQIGGVALGETGISIGANMPIGLENRVWGNAIIASVPFVMDPTSELRGHYEVDNLAIGIDLGTVLHDPLNIANAKYLVGRQTGGGPMVRMIGMDTDNIITLDKDAVAGVKVGAFLSVAGKLVLTPTADQIVFASAGFNTTINRTAPAGAHTIAINDALANSAFSQELTIQDPGVNVPLIATGAASPDRGIGALGARFGDAVVVSTGNVILPAGVFLFGRVSGVDTVAYQVYNLSGVNQTLGFTNFTIHVFKH